MNGLRLVLASVLPFLRGEHDVRVVALDAQREDAPGDDIELVPHRMTRGRKAAQLAAFALRGRPLKVGAMTASLEPAVRAQVAAFAPDVLHVFSAKLAKLHRCASGQRTVLSALDATHLNAEAKAASARGARRIAHRMQARHLRRYMTAEYPAFDAVVTVTDKDAAAVEAVAPRCRTVVIPNGVDVDPAAHWSGAPHSNRLMLHGVMNYPPNIDAAIWAARSLLPRVRAHVPDAELVVVGRSPVPEVQALAALPGVTVTGEVESLAPWLSSSAVYLCPMRTGTGIKNKLLEAMAAGVPSVATPLALQGLAVEPGEHVLVGRDESELVDAAVRLMRDPVFAARLGAEGRGAVLGRHTWPGVAAAYSTLYGEAT